jgi:hypothetical protein
MSDPTTKLAGFPAQDPSLDAQSNVGEHNPVPWGLPPPDPAPAPKDYVVYYDATGKKHEQSERIATHKDGTVDLMIQGAIASVRHDAVKPRKKGDETPTNCYE